MHDVMVYSVHDMMRLLRTQSPYGIYRAAQKYRETDGKQGIPNVQLNGPGSRVIFPKPMVDRWLGARTEDC
jgi:hypothetical protein